MLYFRNDQDDLEAAVDILRTLIADDAETHQKEMFEKLIDRIEIFGEKYLERRLLRAKFGLDLH